jgi:hypothetical protein
VLRIRIQIRIYGMDPHQNIIRNTADLGGALSIVNLWILIRNISGSKSETFLSYILLVLKADLHLMLEDYIHLRHPIIRKIFFFNLGVVEQMWHPEISNGKKQLDKLRYRNGTGTDPFFLYIEKGWNLARKLI